MKLLKVFLIIYGIPSQLLIGSTRAEDQKIYVKGIRCIVSDEYVYKNVSCFAKSYSRTVSTINMVGFTKFPLNFVNVGENTFSMKTFRYLIPALKVEVKLLYKYGTIYREVLHTPVFEWCKFVEENSDDRDFKIKSPLALLYGIIKDSAPAVVHKCPYTVCY